jgi:3-oxoadipate enol-lactonase
LTLHWTATDLTPAWRPAAETIVFTHGVGTSSDVWADRLPVLADRYRLVRFDTRGYGRSPEPPGMKWSLDLLADDVLAVAAAADVAGRFHLVGESLGGTVSLYLASRTPERVRSVSIMSTSHRGASIQHVREWREFVARHGMAGWSAMMMERRFAPGAIDPAQHAWFECLQAQCSADVTLDLADMLVGSDLTPCLPSIAAPTLLLAPGASPFVPIEIPREIHRLVPDAELHEYPGVQHGFVFSHAREGAAAVRDFLARRFPG